MTKKYELHEFFVVNTQNGPEVIVDDYDSPNELDENTVHLDELIVYAIQELGLDKDELIEYIKKTPQV